MAWWWVFVSVSSLIFVYKPRVKYLPHWLHPCPNQLITTCQPIRMFFLFHNVSYYLPKCPPSFSVSTIESVYYLGILWATLWSRLQNNCQYYDKRIFTPIRMCYILIAIYFYTYVFYTFSYFLLLSLFSSILSYIFPFCVHLTISLISLSLFLSPSLVRSCSLTCWLLLPHLFSLAITKACGYSLSILRSIFTLFCFLL